VEPEGLAAKAVTAQGVLLDSVRQAATAALPPAAEEVPDLVPYGPEAKKVLELTFREALRLGHNYIGTEHLLLALLEHENGEGVLSGLGITKTGTEEYVGKVLALLLEQKKAASDAEEAASDGPTD
ncbi:Clp protease N-terminal domain-containing protein, partial [Streptomyces zaomyceticus]